jgi:hypothetical protein
LIKLGILMAGFSRVKPAKPTLDEKELYGVLPKEK